MSCFFQIVNKEIKSLVFQGFRLFIPLKNASHGSLKKEKNVYLIFSGDSRGTEIYFFRFCLFSKNFRFIKIKHALYNFQTANTKTKLKYFSFFEVSRKIKVQFVSFCTELFDAHIFFGRM